MGIDHQCILIGEETLDRVVFYAAEGFYDINITNINLRTSYIICGDNNQYSCYITTTEDGCYAFSDKECEDYRLPTLSPTKTPSYYLYTFPS